jgi:hypothetical protein
MADRRLVVRHMPNRMRISAVIRECTETVKMASHPFILDLD